MKVCVPHFQQVVFVMQDTVMHLPDQRDHYQEFAHIPT